MKYTENYQRDYEFYLGNRHVFNFSGKTEITLIADKNGKTAKEVFYMIDTHGKNASCCEPELLSELLKCKASVNLHIKMWAEDRANGRLTGYEFFGDGETLEWEEKIVDGERAVTPIKKQSIAKELDLPEWVIKAVELQKINLMKKSSPKFLPYLEEQKKTYSSKEYKFISRLPNNTQIVY
jgi:hypothetical protein